MQNENYLEYLDNKLSAVESEMLRARRLEHEGRLKDLVAAAGEFAVLEARHKGLLERADTAREHHAEEWSALRTTLTEDLDSLLDALTQWISRHSV